MLKRLAAFFIVLAFAGQTLAGGFACDGDGSHSAAEMACCKLAKSNAGATIAMLCCQTTCGEPIGGAPGPQSRPAAHLQQVPAPGVAVQIIPVSSLLATGAYPSRSPMEDSLLLRDPPALYLHNSAFLI